MPAGLDIPAGLRNRGCVDFVASCSSQQHIWPTTSAERSLQHAPHCLVPLLWGGRGCAAGYVPSLVICGGSSTACNVALAALLVDEASQHHLACVGATRSSAKGCGLRSDKVAATSICPTAYKLLNPEGIAAAYRFRAAWLFALLCIAPLLQCGIHSTGLHWLLL